MIDPGEEEGWAYAERCDEENIAMDSGPLPEPISNLIEENKIAKELLRDVEWVSGGCPHCDGLAPAEYDAIEKARQITPAYTRGHANNCLVKILLQN